MTLNEVCYKDKSLHDLQWPPSSHTSPEELHKPEVALTWHAKKQNPESYTVCRLLVLAVIHGTEIVQLITCLLAFCMWIKKKRMHFKKKKL